MEPNVKSLKKKSKGGNRKPGIRTSLSTYGKDHIKKDNVKFSVITDRIKKLNLTQVMVAKMIIAEYSMDTCSIPNWEKLLGPSSKFIRKTFLDQLCVVLSIPINKVYKEGKADSCQLMKP